MKRLLNFTLLMSILAFGGLTALGQDDDYNKAEVFVGYSHARVDTGIDDDEFDFDDFDSNLGMHGFNAAVTGNVHKYVGLKFDFSTHSRSRDFADGTDTLTFDLRNNQFLGGVQFKDNRKEGSRVRPFAHVLGGLAHQKLSISGTFTDPTGGGGSRPGEGTGGGTVTTFDESESFNNFAMVFGGGVDVNVSEHVAVRLIQLDYNPVFFRGRQNPRVNLAGRTQHNFRIGIGIVFR